MNINFSKIFPKAEKAPVQVKALRDMRMSIDGINRHVERGEEITLDRKVFDQMDRDDFELLSATTPSAPPILDPSPERPEPLPLPARWESLPPVFHKFHECAEKVRIAREHINLIRDKRYEIFGVHADFADATGTHLVGGMAFPSDRSNKNIISTVRPIDFDDPKNRQVDAFLSKSARVAEAHLAELLEKTSLPQQKRYLECGNCYITATEELRGIIDELEGIGYQLFSTRVAALGLGEYQNRRLFYQSSDHIKYANHGTCQPQGLTSAGYDEHGRLRVFCDLQITTMASHLLTTLSRLADLRPLLAEGKRELAKARKATA